jgi:ATP-dependent RNA helicase DeaD
MAEKLLADHDAVAVVALFVERTLAGRPAGEKLTRVEMHAPSSSSRGPGRQAGKGAPSPSEEMVPFEVNLGAKDRAEANWILPLVCKRGGITRREVGAIRVARDRTYFEVARRVAEEFAANAAERDPRAPHVRVTPASGPMPPRSFSPPASHSRPHDRRAPDDRRPHDKRPPDDRRPHDKRPPDDRRPHDKRPHAAKSHPHTKPRPPSKPHR